MASITIENISKAYGAVDVLSGINLEIRDGEFLSLLGASGCGKSTLLRIIAGLESETRGRLKIGNRDMCNVSPKHRSVSMVFQTYALYPHLTVFENIAIPLVMRNLTRMQRLPYVGNLIGDAIQVRKDIRNKVHALAENLDIADLLDRRPSQLSGGQRQRVALGRAMVREPEVFLMDEPLSNLDSKMRTHMRTELAELHRSLGATFVYVTHDQEEAMTMSDRVAVMMDGRILQVAAPREMYRNPVHRRVAEFIGAPKINMLPCKVLRAGIVESLGVQLTAPDRLKTQGHIGVRPSRLLITHDPENSWTARVINVEDLGSSFLVHSIISEKERVISRLHSMVAIPRVGDTVHLRPEIDCTSFFDDQGWNTASDRNERVQLGSRPEVVSESEPDFGGLSYEPSVAV